MGEKNPAADDIAIEEQGDDAAPMQTHLKSRSTWMRGLFMLLTCVLFNLAALVGAFVVIVGFLWVLFTGATNKQLEQVGQSIAAYLYQIVRYLTFNTDKRPFPFGESWPSGLEDEAS